MKKLNNKGYMLVEIILASVIAMGVAYFMFDLIIKLKNKNDDLLVKTLVYTEQAIIYNKLVQYAQNETESFNCDNLLVDTTNNIVKYGDQLITKVTDYAVLGDSECKIESGSVIVKIPMEVKQIPDENFNIMINYKYAVEDMENPTCELSAIDGSTLISATRKDDSGLFAYYGWNSSYSGENSEEIDVNSTGDVTYYVKDASGKTGTCTITVNSRTVYSKRTCSSNYCSGNVTPTSDGYCVYQETKSFTCNCELSAGSLEVMNYSCDAVPACSSGYDSISISYNGATSGYMGCVSLGETGTYSAINKCQASDYASCSAWGSWSDYNLSSCSAKQGSVECNSKIEYYYN